MLGIGVATFLTYIIYLDCRSGGFSISSFWCPFLVSTQVSKMESASEINSQAESEHGRLKQTYPVLNKKAYKAYLFQFNAEEKVSGQQTPPLISSSALDGYLHVLYF